MRGAQDTLPDLVPIVLGPSDENVPLNCLGPAFDSHMFFLIQGAHTGVSDVQIY